MRRTARTVRSIPAPAGICRARSGATRLAAGEEHCLRLDAARAAAEAGPYAFIDETRGRIEGQPLLFGDVVLARKDTPTSYHLAVTVDDHLQGVTLVTRGEDLLPSTHVHGLLQRLLGYETPAYAHHRLLTDAGRPPLRQARQVADAALAARVRQHAGRCVRADRRKLSLPSALSLRFGQFIALHRRTADAGTLQNAERFGNVGAGSAFSKVALRA